jgi:dihydrofolate synthase/folylpolyglutamate synthase
MINGLDEYKKKWQIRTDSAIKPGLEAISAALAELNHPERAGRTIHIAGTNGKGSTAAFLASILKAHGHSVGNFYSPAVLDLHDQIQVDGMAVTPERLDRAMERLARVKTPLTDFELLTAAAFLVFEEAAPDFTIIEAGMGGRFDSTNVIIPEIAIIPSISLEHTAFLGDTLGKIAYHKAGIIKKWKPIIVGPMPHEALFIIEETAKTLHADLIQPKEPLNIPLRQKGKHQQWNARLAFEAAQELLGFSFDLKKAKEALAETTLPFRFQELYPDVILDGAHNEASIRALVDTVKETYPDREIHIVMGLMQDKDYEAILRHLEEISDRFTFVDFGNKKEISSKILFSENRSKIKTIKTLRDILPVSTKKEVTIVTGSLYFLSALKEQDFRLLQNYKTQT